VVDVTVPALRLNVADVEPCGMVMDAGMLAAVELELESAIVSPPLPAADVRLTVPVPDWPLTILVGLTERVLRVGGGGLIVIAEVALTPE
jgi:hypothetical protein